MSFVTCLSRMRILTISVTVYLSFMYRSIHCRNQFSLNFPHLLFHIEKDVR